MKPSPGRSPHARQSPHIRSSPKTRASPKHSPRLFEQKPEPIKKIIPTKQKLESLKNHQQQINLMNKNENAKLVDRESIVKLIDFQKNFMSNKFDRDGSRKIKVKLPRHKLDIISQERQKSIDSTTNQQDACYQLTVSRGRSKG